jgi:uncharacterized protein
VNLTVLVPGALVGSAISGLIGMGGGALLLAIMAVVLDPAEVVPVHGAVQLASNFTRSLRLWRRVRWSIVALYCPPMIVGAWAGLGLYRGATMPWFRPAIGGFILVSLAWQHFAPKRLALPMWAFVPAGLGGGFLTITVGAAGPYLAAFFLRDDLERREIVATKAAVQTFGHLLKIPAFLSIRFDYVSRLPVILPLLAAVVLGTFAGTHLLHRIPERAFQAAFRILLGALAIRLLLTPWW